MGLFKASIYLTIAILLSNLLTSMASSWEPKLGPLYPPLKPYLEQKGYLMTGIMFLLMTIW